LPTIIFDHEDAELMGKTPLDDLESEKAKAAEKAFKEALLALAVVKGAQLPGARRDYEEAIGIAIDAAMKEGVTQPEALAKVAYEVILSGPSKFPAA
jgi:hypothetical protein